MSVYLALAIASAVTGAVGFMSGERVGYRRAATDGLRMFKHNWDGIERRSGADRRAS